MKKKKLKRKIAVLLQVPQNYIDAIKKSTDGYYVDFSDDVEEVYNEGTRWEHTEWSVEYYTNFFISKNQLV